jgi:hypothetical protein
MSYQCPKCRWVLQVEANDRRLPPWCSKCGADVKPEEWHPVYLPTVVVETTPPQFEGGDEVTTVTSTGPRPWLNRPAPPPAQPAPTAQAVPPPAQAVPEAVEPAGPAPAAAELTEAEAGRLLLVASIAGVALIGVALGLAWKVKTFVDGAPKTTGEVVGVWKPDPLAFAIVRRHYVLEYQVNGVKYELPPGGRSEGERVPIVYPAADPSDGRVNTTGSLYLWPMVVGGLGLLVLAGSLVGACLLPDRKDAEAEAAKPEEATAW